MGLRMLVDDLCYSLKDAEGKAVKPLVVLPAASLGDLLHLLSMSLSLGMQGQEQLHHGRILHAQTCQLGPSSLSLF